MALPAPILRRLVRPVPQRTQPAVVIAWAADADQPQIGHWLSVADQGADLQGNVVTIQNSLADALTRALRHFSSAVIYAAQCQDIARILALKEEAIQEVVGLYDQIPERAADLTPALVVMTDYIRAVEIIAHAVLRPGARGEVVRISAATAGPSSRTATTPHCLAGAARRIFSHQRKHGGGRPMAATVEPEQIANIFRTTRETIERESARGLAEVGCRLREAGFSLADFSALFAAS